MSSPFQDLLAKVHALESRALVLDDLPLASLRLYLEQNWNVDGNTVLLPQSVGTDALLDQGVTFAKLASDAGAQHVTSLPASPQDGQVIAYQADATNGVRWLLRYNAASASAYKWESIGGGLLYNEVTTTETTTSLSYVALATAGPSIALPLGGDYMVEIGCGAWASGGGADLFMSYDIGGTAAVDADAYTPSEPGVTYVIPGTRPRRKTGLAAVTLTCKYKVSGNTGNFRHRWMRVQPVRVG